MSDSTARTPLELWTELKMTMEQLEKDAARNFEKGNVSAGVRLRHGVRQLRKVAAELIKATTSADKSTTGGRRSTKKTEEVSASDPVQS